MSRSRPSHSSCGARGGCHRIRGGESGWPNGYGGPVDSGSSVHEDCGDREPHRPRSPEDPMATRSGELRRSLPALVAGLTVTIVFLAVLSIILTAAGPRGLGLSDRQTSGWIALVYGLPMIPSLVLTL